ncbi:MAG TPA: HAD family phosphatase [Ferruginibacter sp.]|nr:HAD family phosphatase [Ferruginibacter sp.]
MTGSLQDSGNQYMPMIEVKNILTVVTDLQNRFHAKAFIFDLDGTLLDNNQYHLLAWKQYLKEKGLEISDADYRKNVNGRTNKDVIEYIYQRKMTDAEAMVFAQEKEAVYRELYAADIKPVAGLIEFLEAARLLNIPMAIATSGIQVNIDFMFDHVPIRQFFSVIVNSAHISKGKPDPEIYEKAAALLNIPADNCLVFEDAVVGVQSAKAAGMPVVAILTTHPAEELSKADLIVDNFECTSFPS